MSITEEVPHPLQYQLDIVSRLALILVQEAVSALVNLIVPRHCNRICQYSKHAVVLKKYSPLLAVRLTTACS